MQRKNCLNLWLVVCSIYSISLASIHATITVVDYWRLGESDVGTAAGVTAANAIDSAGAENLIFQGNARYSSEVALSASNHIGSTLSVNFTNSAWATNAVVSDAIDNFGIECWVKPTTSGGSEIIAYNGITGGTGNGGWGLIIAADNTYQGLFGGVVAFGTNAATPNVWTHLAFVRASGISTLYINGVVSATNTVGPLVSSTSARRFSLATDPQSQAAKFFTGLIDEVRVFTFAPGQFSTSDLLLSNQLTAATGNASNLAPNTATLNGTVSPNVLKASAWFEWGTTTGYGQKTATTNLNASTVSQQISSVITGLAVGATYHFRLVASNSVGMSVGGDSTFTQPTFFLNTNAGLPGIDFGSVSWGDFDNDGWLDLLFAGNGSPAQIYRNNGDGTFSNMNVNLPSGYQGVSAVGDYDNDGRLDVFVAGQIWRNNGDGTFSNTVSGFPNLTGGSAAWCDYDGDGRLDLLITGNDASQHPVTQLWRNLGNGAFTNVNAGLPAVSASSVAWGDYDNDGRPDVFLSGVGSGGQYITQIWRNLGNGSFSNINAGLPGLAPAVISLGDYDNDGWVDIALGGLDAADNAVAQIWHNNANGTFTRVYTNSAPLTDSSVTVNWGDYDGDGKLDLLVATWQSNAPIVLILHNNGDGTFSDIKTGLPGLNSCIAAWGDYDNDGRLDFVISGEPEGSSGGSGAIGQLWHNSTTNTNSRPNAPTGLTTALSGAVLTLNWGTSSDLQTPEPGLTYNLRVGTTSGGSDIVSPMSAASGFRLLPQSGNFQRRRSWTFPVQLFTNYYWSVQAVDSDYAGSVFAPEQSAKVQALLTPAGAASFTPGDTNHDGVVDSSELAAVIANLGTNRVSAWNVNQVLLNYLTDDPLYMTDVAGLGNSNVTFDLLNSPGVNFTVQSSTDLTTWQPLGTATLKYHFTDTNAPDSNRFYRLVYP